MLYGQPFRHRADLVVNNLVGHAATEGECGLSDGTPWRLVHRGHISRVPVALEVDRAAVHNEAFNVGRNEENYRIREVAEIVHRTVEDSAISFALGAGLDHPQRRPASTSSPRRCRDFGRSGRSIGARSRCWTRCAVTASPPRDSRARTSHRIAQIKLLIDDGRLDSSLPAN